jgi:ADP-heptose:LPS heptosyltransferase/GT2 family glycosyltransferase
MASLFSRYRLVKDSGLFDEAYYCNAYPEIKAANLDPLLHYLETGAVELRNPSEAFDARHYVQLCRERGECVENPLVHYIETGAARGLTPRRQVNSAVHAAAPPNVSEAASPVDQPGFVQPPMLLHIDMAERDDAGILHLVGWVACFAPLVTVQVFIDDKKLATADHGQPRDDVASTHPEYPNARHSGFALHTDIRSYGEGDRVIKVQAVASTGISRETMLPFSRPGTRRTSQLHRDDSKVRCFCERIEVTTGGRFVITGWAVGLAPSERIAVLFDGNEIGDAEIGFERPDVANRFPTLAHARRAGFSFRRVFSAINEGEHQVILRHRAGGDDTDILLPISAVPGSGPDDLVDAVSSAGREELQLNIDLPRVVGGAVAAPIRGNLEIVGWVRARQGVASIDIAIDGRQVKSVYPGLRRIDVQRAFPSWDSALTAGFSALLPQHSLPKGQHTVSISLRDQTGQVARSEFCIEAEDAPDSRGPWSLRRRMLPAEIDVLSRPLLGASQKPSFGVVLPLSSGAKIRELRATLASLAAQAYENWRLYILVGARRSGTLRRALLKGFGELSDRIELLGSNGVADGLVAADSDVSHLMFLRPGDELGCDALLEFAVHATLHPQADFLYSDERRVSPVSGKMEAFFKPQWSPDLLLSMNYLGRAWCARADIFRRAAIRPSEFMNVADYDLVLRLSEHAAAIWHVPATLLQATHAFAANEVAERKALQGALCRRGINASVKSGRAKGTFRMRRKVATRGLVSIIIPTCGSRGLIQTCIKTLRRLTAYRNFEIVCIENIPAGKPDLNDWLRANADRVVATAEPFNWSGFNNRAVAASHGDFLLFLNDDIEIIDPAWLDALLEHAERPDVGAVGPQLLYPDRRVQHAGIFLAAQGLARHAFRYAAEEDPGYFGLALTQRDIIAVTGACLMTRRETFLTLGGFDETHDVVNNDVDYCLRGRQHGLRTIYTPHTKLIHHELASRSEIADSDDAAAFEKKWRSVFAAGDPFFHPRLAKDRDDYSFEWEPAELYCAGHPVLARESIRRILIVKLDHIGDCVIAFPAVRRLKRHFPEARFSVLTSRASKAVWALEPTVDELIEFEFFHARSSLGLVERTEDDLHKLRGRLAPYRFDLAIDLRKHWETRPLLQYTGARYLAGFDIKGKFPWLDVAIEWSEDSALIRKRQHAADDLVNLVDAVAAASEADRAVIAQMPHPLSRAALTSVPMERRIFRKRVVCVHPSAGNEMRQWPAEYFSLLIDQLIETENVHVILVGRPDEAEIGSTILNGIANPKSVWSLIECVGLEDLPALIARCSLFIGNNSGPHHIAAGMGIPTVGIHSGVVDAREWGPKGTNAVAIQRAMTCAPCYLSKLEDCNRGLACLRGLLPADVLQICRRVLATAASGPNGAKLKRSPTDQTALRPHS